MNKGCKYIHVKRKKLHEKLELDGENLARVRRAKKLKELGLQGDLNDYTQT